MSKAHSLAGIAAGPIAQIGCVVEDIEAAERSYSELFGVPAWTRITDVAFGPDRTTYRGAPADYAINVALGYAGDQQIELIQPVRGVNIYTEYLERSGPGVHHLAWISEDYEGALERARRAGIEVVTQGGTDEMDFAYLETPGLGAHFVELLRLSPGMSAFFESMRAAAAAAVPLRS